MLITLLPSTVKINGAVSPAPRANANITPVTIPGKAAGIITVNVEYHVGAPSPRAASRIDSGTSFNISSVVRVTMGIIKIISARLPAIAENCWL